jgi:L-fuculose-phosphate aldolase
VPLALTPKLRSTVVATARRLHASGWVANHDGNVTARLKGDRLLATPTAVSKAAVEDASLIVVDFEGRVLEGRFKPFSEMDLHLAAYRARLDIEAVVHAHPPYATACGVAGASLLVATMPEVAVSLGRGIPTAPLAMPKTPESARAVTDLVKEFDAILLPGNGALTLGVDLEQAYLRMELVEHYAKIITIGRSMGSLNELPTPMLDKLLEQRRKIFGR